MQVYGINQSFCILIVCHSIDTSVQDDDIVFPVCSVSDSEMYVSLDSEIYGSHDHSKMYGSHVLTQWQDIATQWYKALMISCPVLYHILGLLYHEVLRGVTHHWWIGYSSISPMFDYNGI